MADIAPFRGILYTPQAGDPSKLLAPPYDVISEAERANLAKLDPHNCVRLILPEADPKDKDADAKYGRAAADFNAWLGDGTLRRDDAPAIYRYHQTFEVNGKEVTRRGFIARVRLLPFSDGVILPHERTLAGPKADRLKLMRATKAHFSQIFGLYTDPNHRTDALFEEVEKQKPDLEGTTTDGVAQRVWRLTDRAAQRGIIEYMSAEKIYIADGHHRYETMLALSGELCGATAKDAPPVPASSAARYGVMYFCNMDDPGLTVLPTHRVLFGLPQFDRREVLGRATEFFKIMEGPVSEPAAVRAALAGHGKKAQTIAMMTPGASTVAYLRLRGDLIKSSVPALAESRALGEVDVTLLHSLMLEIILGVSREAQEKQTHLRYVKDMEKALAALTEPDVQAVFLLNPTAVSQLRAVADEGQVMPQKSTFFYPKIASGLVMNPIDVAEEVE